MGPYTASLDPKKKEIRQLVLQPLKDGDIIQCSTETISLLEQPEFEALSYVWGDASIRQTITFNGFPFTVTQNLAIALRYLRLPEKPRRIWIDALCINQEDTSERNSQVSMMGEIYRCANPVLIWLGESSEDTDEAFALISHVSKDHDITEETSQLLFSFYIQLVGREWFTRLWTIQELVLAKQDPLIGCGHSWTTWGTVFGMWQRVAMKEFSKMGMVMLKEGRSNEDKDSVNVGVRPNVIRIDLLNNLRVGVASKRGEDLRDLLLNTVSSNATEPRDRIYGLLGMLSDQDRQYFNVDYNRPLGTVFAEAVSHIFRNGKGAFLLSGLNLAGPNSSDPSFPSWVPKFGTKSLLTPSRFHPAGIGASGSGSDAINGEVDSNLQILRIRGLPVDIIVDKFVFDESVNSLTHLRRVEALAKEARELVASHSTIRPYLHGFKTSEPLWRTLIANKASSGATRESAPESYSEMYEKILENPLSERDESVREYRLSLLNHLPSSCFFITATGFCGIGPDIIENGDQLAIWFGAPAPFILRQYALAQDDHEKQIYSVCGVAYVAGIMEGQMVDEVYCEDLEDDIVFVVR
ncbi:hypothetical protein HYFRA_00012502 [Hymenoscyphus fraxineus]|uniref:Heterokaryon incompatibility domain-containing protein n=1 Tax=Hymenoscyphus fraxineus TaxID=746836 RepID=A0A9N9PWW1_9HELO|nr:hypothetical protein HYFRA_00012502 [Hymenoscyphus fraxineus]